MRDAVECSSETVGDGRKAAQPLLQRDQHFDHAGAGVERAKCLADHSAEHLAAVGALHGAAWRGRSHQQIADLDGTVFRDAFLRGLLVVIQNLSSNNYGTVNGRMPSNGGCWPSMGKSPVGPATVEGCARKR